MNAEGSSMTNRAPEKHNRKELTFLEVPLCQHR